MWMKWTGKPVIKITREHGLLSAGGQLSVLLARNVLGIAHDVRDDPNGPLSFPSTSPTVESSRPTLRARVSTNSHGEVASNTRAMILNQYKAKRTHSQ